MEQTFEGILSSLLDGYEKGGGQDIQAAFKRAKTQEAKDALVSVFTSVGGNPIWKED